MFGLYKSKMVLEEIKHCKNTRVFETKEDISYTSVGSATRSSAFAKFQKPSLCLSVKDV